MDLVAAFRNDGFKLKEEITFRGQRGLLAEHETAYNVVTGEKKIALYVEGTAYEMGFLTGFLAHHQVERMCEEFLENFAPAFLGIKFSPLTPLGGILKWILTRIFIKTVYEMAKGMAKDIPNHYKIELEGILDGCRAANPRSKVDFEDLWALNMGFDCLLALIYSPGFLERWPRFKEKHVRVPVGCNGFAVFGQGVKPLTDGARPFFFGRDFMFPTAGVFQDVACHLIYKPSDGRYPLLSLTAPGLIGSVTVLNSTGLAVGVDMVASGNCSPKRPGLNSLILIRDCAHQCGDLSQAIDYMVQAQRGVSWIYLLASRADQRACVVEAGQSISKMDLVSFPPDDLMQKGLLPDSAFLAKELGEEPRRGLVVRFSDYQYPQNFLRFNKSLFEYFDKQYDAAAFGPKGYLCQRLSDGRITENLPHSFYFAPLRVGQPDLLLVSNHFITPAMRMAAMEPWCANLASKQQPDFQWRYDKLNDLLQTYYGQIDEELAWRIINFLAAEEGSFVPDYYKKASDYVYRDLDGHKQKTKEVPGAVSLCELTSLSMQSRWGYYADKPVRTRLPNYIEI